MREQIDIRLPRLLDLNLNEVARIVPEKLSYELTLSEPSTATLVMNKSEATVTVGQFMELYETYGSIGFFRVDSVETTYKPGLWDRILMALGLKEITVTVTLKHAVCTMEDGIIFGYREYGGTGKNLKNVLQSLLALQPRAYWRVGTVDYTTYYQYSFENESNLLAAVLSTAELIADEHMWTFDFTTAPWTLNLITASDDLCEMRMNRNAESVKVDVDRSNLCNRIYPLGYGEGVNQLTIAKVNGGIKYLEDKASQAAWGIVALPHADTTITDAATLKAVAQAQLDTRKDPAVTITITGQDLSAITGEQLDRLYIGRMCRAPLPDYGVTVLERIVSIRKADVYRDNAKAQITLANLRADVVSQMASTARKTMIGELYSQGATNQYARHFADNADSTHPARLRFRVDQNAVHVNSVSVVYELKAFRGYSKGAANGGGGTSTVTSQNGGYSSGVKYTGVKLDSDTHASAPYTEAPNQTTFSGHRHVDDHVHAITIVTPSHGHEVTVNFSAHEHETKLGIYEGATASSVVVKVDGNTVPASAISDGEFDAVSYLTKDSDGRITRGAWHEITFTPSGNTRIEADVHVQTFIRSITGGNF